MAWPHEMHDGVCGTRFEVALKASDVGTALKARPAPVNTITLTAGSISMSSSVRMIAASRSLLSAFSFAGRFSVRIVTPLVRAAGQPEFLHILDSSS